MGELKALKMIQAKNYKHPTFDIDTGESRKTGEVHSSTRKLYWAMPLQVCVCWGGVPHSWSQFRVWSTGWGSGLCYSKTEEGRDLPGRGRLKTEKETR